MAKDDQEYIKKSTRYCTTVYCVYYTIQEKAIRFVTVLDESNAFNRSINREIIPSLRNYF